MSVGFCLWPNCENIAVRSLSGRVCNVGLLIFAARVGAGILSAWILSDDCVCVDHHAEKGRHSQQRDKRDNGSPSMLPLTPESGPARPVLSSLQGK